MTDRKGATAPGFQSEKDATEYAKRRLVELRKLIDAGRVRAAQAEALALSMALSRLAEIRESGDG